MKKRLLCLFLIGFLLCGIGLSGCTGFTFDERKAYFSAETTLYTTCQILLDYQKQGYIPDAEWAKILVWTDLASVALDAWHRALITETDPTGPYMEFRSVFQQLIKAQLEIERRKAHD